MNRLQNCHSHTVSQICITFAIILQILLRGQDIKRTNYIRAFSLSATCVGTRRPKNSELIQSAMLKKQKKSSIPGFDFITRTSLTLINLLWHYTDFPGKPTESSFATFLCTFRNNTYLYRSNGINVNFCDCIKVCDCKIVHDSMNVYGYKCI